MDGLSRRGQDIERERGGHHGRSREGASNTSRGSRRWIPVASAVLPRTAGACSASAHLSRGAGAAAMAHISTADDHGPASSVRARMAGASSSSAVLFGTAGESFGTR